MQRNEIVLYNFTKYLAQFLSESWGPSSLSETFARDENWADFSKTPDGGLPTDDDELESRR